MTTQPPFLLAIDPDAGESESFAQRWASALAGSGLGEPVLWCPSTPTVDAHNPAMTALRGLGLPVREGEPGNAAAILTTGRHPALATILATAGDYGFPVLVEHLYAHPPDVLRDLLTRTRAQIVPAHHLNYHHGFTPARQAVETAQIGLLRAVALDLVISEPEGDGTPAGVLHDLGGQALDLIRSLTGPTTVQAHARRDPAGSWTLLGRSGHDVVLTAHLARICSESATVHALLRVTGTDGYLTVDLTAPTLQVRTATGTRGLPYGESARTACLRHLVGIAAGTAQPPTIEDMLALAQALAQLERASTDHHPTTLTW